MEEEEEKGAHAQEEQRTKGCMHEEKPGDFSGRNDETRGERRARRTIRGREEKADESVEKAAEGGSCARGELFEVGEDDALPNRRLLLPDQGVFPGPRGVAPGAHARGDLQRSQPSRPCHPSPAPPCES